MDFYQIRNHTMKSGQIVIAPDFIVGRSKDLMIRGGGFYAIWDEQAGLWSTDELVLQNIVDADIFTRVTKLEEEGKTPSFKTLSSFRSQMWSEFRRYVASLPDSFVTLDSKITFANTPPRREDYSSKRLPYALEDGPIKAYDKLVGTLYNREEREKLEWAIGSVLCGDSVDIQKFIVLYGDPGTGKGTFLNILEKLFEGYWAAFDAKAATDASNTFSSDVFKTNCLVAIQHDGDLSKIRDNTKLSLIVSHEEMVINEKYKTPYSGRAIAFIFIGSNQTVRITDSMSGLIRRLIDVRPSGRLVPPGQYHALVSQIGFELGAIAHHCVGVYRGLGKYYYETYKPVDMIVRTDIFYNYLLANYDLFRDQDGTTLKQAWTLYKEYCEESGIEFRLQMHKFRDELRNYFETFSEKVRVEGVETRSWFAGFRNEKLGAGPTPMKSPPALVMEATDSILDEMLGNYPAQYANEEGTPVQRWSDVKTTLNDLDTSKLHYVKPGSHHIVIDFDIRDSDGQKSLELNTEAASQFPPTYAELSQGGAGIHLHYFWEGDTSELSHIYGPGVEVKTFTGDASLRRRLTRCNSIFVASLSSGLPIKERRVIESSTMQSERSIRNLVVRTLGKEFHAGTKPSIDFITKILDDAYKSGIPYDLTDMRNRILSFANNSTNHPEYCIKAVMAMKFKSEEEAESVQAPEDRLLGFFDVEVFSNLFVVCWKVQGTPESAVVKMINPSPSAIEELVKMPLVGFNNRRYDNHILYARIMGYNELELYKLSKKLISGEKNAFFGDAYGLSAADIFDFSSVKASLKKFQIDLGLHHRELGLDWDKPVDPKLWDRVAEYCANDVVTEEAVFNDRIQDYVARQILAALSGLTVNDTTQKHTARIVFGRDKHPQDKFVYTDLSETFPGYKYDMGVSTYKEEVVGEGGYVYAEPGMYRDVAVLDIASMHPTSIELLNLFGPYTKTYSDLKKARIAIKRKDYEAAGKLLDGRLLPFLDDNNEAVALSYALKIVLNIVYGLTSAVFDNPFRDIRNKDNIVAKRGALFMIDLKEAVQARGFQVVHIKTDSIKIPDATPDIIEFVRKFGEDYGYDFEHEVTYQKFCLVNDAVYIAKTMFGEWTATRAQFAHPFVYKTLFSKEPLVFNDYTETRIVTKGALYLDNGDGDPCFIGRAGSFVPVIAGTGGGTLLRGRDGVYHSATASKGYEWRESEVVRELGLEADIDMRYFRKLVDDAIKNISKFGDVEWLTS
jgi:hypothetical protein